jgi:hypothetical protein
VRDGVSGLALLVPSLIAEVAPLVLFWHSHLPVWQMSGVIAATWAGHVDCRRRAVGSEIDSLNSAGYLASQHPVLFTSLALWQGYRLLLYWLREWCRVACATIEILIGFWTLYNSTPVTELERFSRSLDQFYFGAFTNIQYLTIIAAIYLMVRGLDNLDRAFDRPLDGSRSARHWG